MKGIIKIISRDEKSGRHFGVQLGESIFSVPDDQVDIRMLNEGQEVTFITDRETGKAILDTPEPVIGCERARK